MSKFFGDFRQRFLSTLAMIAILAATLAFGKVGIAVIGSLLVCVLTYEWLNLCKIQRRKIFLVIVPILLSALYAAYLGRMRLSLGILFSVSSLGIFLSWFAWHRRFLWGSLALLYFGLPFACLLWMVQQYQNGPAILIWIIMVVSGCDMGGYVFGSLLKGPKIVPEISPKKTWSGVIGGLFAAFLFGGLGYKLLAFQKPPTYICIASIVLALVAILGDLIESLIKRYHHAKDAGSWIPGHGGFLDRLDSYLFVFPVTVWMVGVAPDIFDAFVGSFQEWWTH